MKRNIVPEVIMEMSVIIPSHYSHQQQIEHFRTKIKYAFGTQGTDRLIINELCPNSARLTPGQQYVLKLFAVNKSFTKLDHINLYKQMGAILCGVRGLTLAYEMCPELFSYNEYIYTPAEGGEGFINNDRNSTIQSNAYIRNFGHLGIVWGVNVSAFFLEGMHRQLCYFPLAS